MSFPAWFAHVGRRTAELVPISSPARHRRAARGPWLLSSDGKMSPERGGIDGPGSRAARGFDRVSRRTTHPPSEAVRRVAPTSDQATLTMNHAPRFALAILGAVTLGGCSYAPALPVRLPERPAAVPADVVHEDGTFVGVHELKLYAQAWRPRAEPKAVVVLVHGLKDHSARYAPLAAHLVKEGFAVHAFDLRGHGRSEGMRVGLGAFDDYLEDLDLFLKRVRAREHDKPVLLFGHSMGGAIVTLYTITHKPALAGLALSAPALATDVSGATIGGTKLIAALAPNAGVFNLDLHQFSRDPAVVAEGLADPLVYQGAAPAQMARELLGAFDRLKEHLGEVNVPVLAMHGELDKVTPPAGSRALVERAQSKDKTLKLYPGLVHDLLHEPEKEQVIGDLVKWMNDHAQSGAAPVK
ncbi:Lysophospholipase [Minicystis rosea]|nr:Lysophospholipase [Minicystis rosea]